MDDDDALQARLHKTAAERQRVQALRNTLADEIAEIRRRTDTPPTDLLIAFDHVEDALRAAETHMFTALQAVIDNDQISNRSDRK